jgi:hypothetical protein
MRAAASWAAASAAATNIPVPTNAYTRRAHARPNAAMIGFHCSSRMCRLMTLSLHGLADTVVSQGCAGSAPRVTLVTSHAWPI